MLWTNLSIKHLESAKHLANLSKEVEDNYVVGEGLARKSTVILVM